MWWPCHSGQQISGGHVIVCLCHGQHRGHEMVFASRWEMPPHRQEQLLVLWLFVHPSVFEQASRAIDVFPKETLWAGPHISCCLVCGLVPDMWLGTIWTGSTLYNTEGWGMKRCHTASTRSSPRQQLPHFSTPCCMKAFQGCDCCLPSSAPMFFCPGGSRIYRGQTRYLLICTNAIYYWLISKTEYTRAQVEVHKAQQTFPVMLWTQTHPSTNSMFLCLHCTKKPKKKKKKLTMLWLNQKHSLWTTASFAVSTRGCIGCI